MEKNNKKQNKKNKKKSKKVTAPIADNSDQAATASIISNEISTIDNVEVKEETSKVNNDDDNVVVVVEETKDLAEAIGITPIANNINEKIEQGPVKQVIQTLTTQTKSSASNFDNLQKAVDILGKAKSLDESKQFEDALKLYRQGVDMLLEELIERQGTEQSRTYLRDKCNDFMNRIDQIKLIIRIEKETANKEN